MATKRRKKRATRKGRRKSRKTRSSKGHIPLRILEKRLVKLHRIVKSRGGKTHS